MARRAEGWKLTVHRGIYHVRFTHQGHRYRFSTGTRLLAEAQETAAKIYSDVVSGRVKRTTTGAISFPNQTIDELAAIWIADIAAELGRETDLTYLTYSNHWQEHFGTLGRVSDATCASYVRNRLKKVQASTVRKEKGALARFVAWLHSEGHISAIPLIPSVPRKALGTKNEGIRQSAAEVDHVMAETILALLPRVSGSRLTMPVQAYFRFLYETALRPEGTVDQLEWRDVTPFGLHIRPECDKNRWTRTIPLSDLAKAALDDVRAISAPKGLDQRIFGSHDLRESFEIAVNKAYDASPPPGLTRYALKHARITHWFELGATIPAVKFLTGIQRTETLDKYMRASRRAAEGLLTMAKGNQNSGSILAPSPIPLCEGEDLNLHGNYPASTSSSRDSQEHSENGRSEAEKAISLTHGKNISGSGSQNPLALRSLPALLKIRLHERARVAGGST